MAATVEVVLPDIDSLKKVVRDQLSYILASNDGPKDLFIDPNLMKAIDRLTDIKYLKQLGVQKVFKLDTSRAIESCKQRIYITRPTVFNTKLIVEQIQSENSATTRYTIIMVPRSLYVCEKVLEEHGLMGLVTLETLPFELLPIDRDIITMELDFFYTSFFLNRDETWVHTIASALVTLQEQFGSFSNVYTIGTCSKHAWELAETLIGYRRGPEKSSNSDEKSQFGHLIIIDRDIDLVTPLCSQRTYESLLDEIFGIQCGVVEFDEEMTGTGKPMKLLLNSSDNIYADIRNRHISTVNTYLSSKVKELQIRAAKKDNLTVQQMKDFVANDLQKLSADQKSLTIHISACESVVKRKTLRSNLEELLATEHGILDDTDTARNIKYIEESIYQQTDAVDVLRLMCLMSVVKGGVPADTYEMLKTIFLQSYGYDYLAVFHNLSKLGLFTKKQASVVKVQVSNTASIKLPTSKLNLGQKSSFQILSKSLHLIGKDAQEVDIREPTSMSYVFNGTYTPLSCKLIEQILEKRGLSGLEENLKLITDDFDCKVKPISARVTKQGTSQPKDIKENTILVFFIGGITYSEVACLRLLSRVKGCGFLIVTTNTITGNRLITKVMEA